MSAGVYHLATGSTDHQTPHDRDELYYVTAGHGRFEVAGKDIEVHPGMVIYVEAEAEHRFHSITEDLSLLVFFAGAK